MKTILAAMALAAAALPASASPPTGDYRSTTAAYTPYREKGIADWRASNDEMARLNGHMGHMGGQMMDHMDDRKDPPMEHGRRPAMPASGGRGGQP